MANRQQRQEILQNKYNKQMNKAMKYKEDRDVKEMSECTFTPVINAKKKSY